MSIENSMPVIIGLAVGVAFIILLGLLSSIDFQAKRSFDAKFARYRGTMELSLDMRSIGSFENTHNITSEEFNRILNMITNCENGLLKLFYAGGSMEIALDGPDKSGNCPMAADMVFYNVNVHPPEQKLDCLVPLNALETWMTWANRILPSADEISPYCVKV